MVEVTIRWRINDRKLKDYLKEKMGVPRGETVNGECTWTVSGEQLEKVKILASDKWKYLVIKQIKKSKGQ